MQLKNKAIIIALTCGSLFSAASYANSATMNITGKIIAGPCVVNGGTDTLDVNLGDSIQADTLATSGSATDWTNFSLALTSCPSSTTSFSVAFSGTADDTVTSNYKNSGTASNVSIALTTQDGVTTLGNGSSLANVAIPDTHAYDLKLRARAVSKGSVMPGTISSQVQATFTYQ
ncbi:fimbrial protein [Klebsiella aerogenes]|uniref:fimbrial protein n=1 Tax=Klebsiella aerogenes TaxID=548 RepID=UPI00292CD9A7|nr:fimbrial protein [Klebsiella aerogenes]